MKWKPNAMAASVCQRSSFVSDLLNRVGTLLVPFRDLSAPSPGGRMLISGA